MMRTVKNIHQTQHTLHNIFLQCPSIVRRNNKLETVGYEIISAKCGGENTDERKHLQKSHKQPCLWWIVTETDITQTI